MKRTLTCLLLVAPFLLLAQPKIKTKKYPSLLWEITGNGLKKTSYLFGTMHVSSKLAFQLADSFYMGIKNADVVALETNPESWQEDMSKYKDSEGDYSYGYGSYISMPDEYLSINTLKFYKYDKKLERTLYSNPSVINNLLYRTYGNGASDFEEDTYLDMYIYQCGKKWGKKVAGVERYAESMKLMAEAYKDAAKDKNRKERSYDREENYSPDKLQDAYRNGNLDLLDSINRYNSFSAAFDEKFLYRRNEIQANSIDSILKTNSSLFVGVGAAHLPGDRGVIELLRKMGYKLRPVKMGARDGEYKNVIEKLRVPVVFSTQTAEDGLFKVDIPGKFYKFGDDISLDQRQYADMANGSYYMVSRVMTNAWMWGHDAEDVYKKVDSLLYENIPGKILSKASIVKNGYHGFAITNKTRRGDMQRYNIFVTPFEVIFFKMSGTGDYVKNGIEADKFFNSIQFREYRSSADLAAGTWKKYSPVHGGFSVELPHDPYIGNDGSWIYDAEDKTGNARYRVICSDVHNYNFVEEDTFDLGLMDESFAASEFIDTQISRKQSIYKGYPALDCKYLDKEKSVYLTRFIIRGPHYYTLVAYGKQETPRMHSFLNSFEIKPFAYREATEKTDTSLYFTVKTPVFPEEKKDQMEMPRYNYYNNYNDDDDDGNDWLQGITYRSKVIKNDTTGEKIFVSFYKTHRYYTATDSSLLDEDSDMSKFADSAYIVRMKKRYELPNKIKVWERIISDTGSSRAIWSKIFYRDGISFSLITECDTLDKPSTFVQSFFDSFVPADTLKGTDPFAKKSPLFFADFMSSDSAEHKRAVKGINFVKIDSTDFTSLKKAISALDWKEKKYLDTKKALIGKLDDIHTRAASDYLKQLYYAAGDTIELQYTTLETLLKQKTPYAFSVFRDIVTEEPPVLDISSDEGSRGRYYRTRSYYGGYSSDYSNGSFIDELYDSLPLTKTILTELLPLLNVDDYEEPVMRLLGQMVDSNLVKPKDYQLYFSKFLIEAKQEMKKQKIAEKNKAIKKAEQEKLRKNDSPPDDDDEKDYGNEDLSLYATLLLPYYDTHASIQPLIQQMLNSEDKQLRYNTMLLLIRNNKPFPDSLLAYFGSLEEYRYDLYDDLKKAGKIKMFPSRYNNHLDLGKSKLMGEKSYDKPDSVIYIDRLAAEIKGKKGFVYFYKYKMKKDDMTWKLATVGLLPQDTTKFEFDDIVKPDPSDVYNPYSRSNAYRYDFTGFGETKIKDDEPLQEQLSKTLKRMIYSKRKSAREFYGKESSGYDYTSSRIDFGD